MFTDANSQREVEEQFVGSWLRSADLGLKMNIDNPKSIEMIQNEIRRAREGAEKRVARLEALLNNPKYFKQGG